MIDGLKLTFTGEELRRLLDKRIRLHEQMADRWTREQARTSDDESEDAPLLPSHMCEAETERHAWRASVLAFIRDHVEAGEMYRLDSAALEFGELLPAMPESLEQQEYEERTAVGFSLGRLVTSVDRLAASAGALVCRSDSPQHGDSDTTPGDVSKEARDRREAV